MSTRCVDAGEKKRGSVDIGGNPWWTCTNKYLHVYLELEMEPNSACSHVQGTRHMSVKVAASNPPGIEYIRLRNSIVTYYDAWTYRWGNITRTRHVSPPRLATGMNPQHVTLTRHHIWPIAATSTLPLLQLPAMSYQCDVCKGWGKHT